MIVGWPQVRSHPMFLMEPNCLGYFVCSGKQAFVTINININTYNKSAIMCGEYQQKGKAWEHRQTTRLNNHRKASMGKFTPNLLFLNNT